MTLSRRKDTLEPLNGTCVGGGPTLWRHGGAMAGIQPYPGVLSQHTGTCTPEVRQTAGLVIHRSVSEGSTRSRPFWPGMRSGDGATSGSGRCGEKTL